jgi:hypothetical protein
LTFFDRPDREIDRVKATYPGALYVGPADGAKDNWLYLDPQDATAGGGLLARHAVRLVGG